MYFTIEDIIQKEFFRLNVIKPESKPPTNYNSVLYYWWRRFPTHKFLPLSSKSIEKAKNGDFDYSPYWKYIDYEYYWLAEELSIHRSKRGDKHTETEIISNYNKRIRKLTEDAEIDEKERMNSLRDSLIRDHFKSNMQKYRDKVENFILNFEGTIEECILEFEKHKDQI